jgi:hypothetical protein
MIRRFVVVRRAVMLAAALSLGTHSVSAQTRVYVTGDLFADITRFSQVAGPDTLTLSRARPPDGIEAGGGGRIGAFFSPAWSLELGFDLGRTHTRTETMSYPTPLIPGLIIRPVSFESKATVRFAATSMLIGYHPAVSGRVRPGFRGGVSVMHTREAFTLANSSFLFSDAGLTAGLVGMLGITALPSPVTVEQYTVTSNGLTATVGAEAAIALSDHLAVTPELRLHGGALGGILLRPGVSVRWTF